MSIRRIIVPAVLIAAVATGCKRPADESAAPAAKPPVQNTVPVRPEPVAAEPVEPTAAKPTATPTTLPTTPPTTTPPSSTAPPSSTTPPSSTAPALEDLQTQLARLTDKLQGLNMASGLFGDPQLNEILADFTRKTEATRSRMVALQASGEADSEAARRELAGMIGEIQAADAQAVERIKQLR